LYGSGKFNDSGIPFSAFGELFQRLIDEIKSAKLLDRIQTAVTTSPEIGKGTEGCKVLRETWPILSALLDGANTSGESEKGKLKRSDSAFNLVGSTVTMNSIKAHALTLLELLSSDTGGEGYEFTVKAEEPSQITDPRRRHPNMIVFFDDLQWADSPSLDLLAYFLSESRFLNIMFVCAYRSNEVDENHPLQRVIDEATSRTTNSSDRSLMSDKEDSGSIGNTYRLELYPLSPTSIQQFIATTLDKEATEEDIINLSEVVYKKTMGNIFYVKQALEELVRKNALYYDMMCFEWQFTNSQDADLLGEYISNDVVSSVRGKIGVLDVKLQLALNVMSHIPNNTIEVDMLLELLLSTGTEMSVDELVKLLKVGVEEGMLLLSSESGHHIFAHDRIRQASRECIEGEPRDEMLLQLANVLLAMYNEEQSDTEWCIYVAVDFLNSFEPGVKSDAMGLARLNLKVAMCAHKKGAVDREYALLSHGLECLKAAEKVWEEYDLSLQLYNSILEATQILGKY
jgi:predicted ATPase